MTTSPARAEFIGGRRFLLHLFASAGRAAEQLAIRSVPPSTMSLLGMIRDLARVEHS